MGEFDEHERRLWAGRAQAYRQSFAELCAHTVPALLDAARVGPGVRVLDVGTGPGTAAVAAAGLGAVVTAVDADPGMAALAAAALPGADVRVALLPELPFADGAYDAVVGNFVVNHVGRPAAALAELRRVARPGGWLAATIWADEGNGSMELFGRALAAEVQWPVLPRVPAELNFERTAAGFGALAAGAGWAGAGCREIRLVHRVDPELWWAGVAAGVANLGLVVTSQPAGVIAAVKREYDRLAGECVEADGLLSVPGLALLAYGRSPQG